MTKKLLNICKAWLGDRPSSPVLINEQYGKLYCSPKGRYYVTNMVNGNSVNLHYAENISMRDYYIFFDVDGEMYELNFISFTKPEDVLKGESNA